MAQERIDDFIEMAKDYARAEKELEMQQWVFVSFERKDEYGNYIRLFSYDLPREVFERRRWVADWRNAKLICKYPKGNVRYSLSFYDRRLGKDEKMQKCLRELVSAKAQVSKMKRIISEYVSYHKEHDLFFNEDNDAELSMAREKLARKEAGVKAAEERLKNKIIELNSLSLQKVTRVTGRDETQDLPPIAPPIGANH